MTAVVLRGDAAHLPLPDGSADLIVTSPPYFGQRDYRDGGESLAGQIGSEETPAEYIAALLRCTAEWMRVLKRGGSIFVNLGDKYSNYFGSNWGHGRNFSGERGESRVPIALPVSAPRVYGIPAKSLMGLPWRYAFGCTDDLGLILRRDIIWSKPNGLPESVTDRCRSSHEYVFHLVRQPRYFSAVDEIREPHLMRPQRRPNGHHQRQALGVLPAQTYSTSARDEVGVDGHPLGKLPGSVWSIPSAPLFVPEHIEHARCCGGRKRPGCEDGLDHHAAFPAALVKKIILGWCPARICLECGQGRFPVTEYTGETGRHPGGGGTYRAMRQPGAKDTNLADATLRYRQITGYACPCTPYTDHEGTGQPTIRREYNPYPENGHAQCGVYGRKQAGQYDRVGPWREYQLDGWTAPPSRPALVVDPFAGTGTTMLTASVLGRIGIGVDRSGDYCRLARWRCSDPGERARALGVPKPPPIPDGQGSLFEEIA